MPAATLAVGRSRKNLVVAYGGYVYLVPSLEEDAYYFLKTIIPSRKATRDYLERRPPDEEAGSL
jgi:hypothetical protein